MKIPYWHSVILLLGLLATTSCNQDPIFYTIHKETAPVPPLIKGAPTNMVVFDWEEGGPPVMYVASDRLFWYAKNEAGSSVWNSSKFQMPPLRTKIVSLAATKNRLYALCMDGSGVQSTLRYIDRNERVWKTISIGSHNYPLIQSIHADREKPWLFAGARQTNPLVENYGILCVNDEDDGHTLKLLQGNTGMLSGAISRDDSYFLSTQGKGIYQFSGTLPACNCDPCECDPCVCDSIKKLTDNSGDTTPADERWFMGMIKLNDGMIIAVERDGGQLFKVTDSGSFERVMHKNGSGIATGSYATGALALWEEINPKPPGEIGEGDLPYDTTWRLLIAGIQGSLYNTISASHTHGYVEFDLNIGDGSLVLDATPPRRETSTLVSVSDPDRYTSSIGKHPINHLFQSPWKIDEKMTFFASTQTAGLWSYKERTGGLQWNAEN